VQIFLTNEQRLILPSLEASELTEDNFIFHEDSNKDQNDGNSIPLNLSSMISLGLLLSCAGLFGFLVKMNQRDEDEESTYSRKDTLIQVPEAAIEVDTQSENVVPLESPNEKLPSEECSSEDEHGDNDSVNSSKEEEQSKLSENDWDLFSALNSFFSSDNDSDAVQTLEGKLESVFNVFDVVDPEEQEVQSFVFTESDDEQETNDRDNIDIEGN
jgi:hypothetical protein